MCYRLQVSDFTYLSLGDCCVTASYNSTLVIIAKYSPLIDATQNLMGSPLQNQDSRKCSVLSKLKHKAVLFYILYKVNRFCERRCTVLTSTWRMKLYSIHTSRCPDLEVLVGISSSPSDDEYAILEASDLGLEVCVLPPPESASFFAKTGVVNPSAIRVSLSLRLELCVRE